jgi:hypothetical protein
MPPSVLRTASNLKNKNLLKIAQNKEVSSSAASGKSFKNNGTYIYFCTVSGSYNISKFFLLLILQNE